MLVDHYAAYGLRLRTPRLELRLPDLADLARLGEVAATGVHDPAAMPFGFAWTDAPPETLAREVINYQLRTLASSAPQRWTLPFVACHDGDVIGVQALSAEDFAVVREVGTGSWLGRAVHRHGYGTEMRAAVLHLAFAGLDAQWATSDARDDNLASNGVSRRLGYRPDGIRRQALRGEAATFIRLRLSRADWETHRTVPVTLEGVEAFATEVGLSS